MPLLNDAKTCYVGTQPITKIYAGTQMVWPKEVLAQNLRIFRWAANNLTMYAWEAYPVGPCCAYPRYETAFGQVGIPKLTEIKTFGCTSSGGFQAYSYLPPEVPGLIKPNTMVCSGKNWGNGGAGLWDAGLIYYPVPAPANSGEEIIRITVENSTLEEIPTEFLQNRCPKN